MVPPWLGAGDGAEGSPASGRDLGTAGRRRPGRPLAADQGPGRGRLAAPRSGGGWPDGRMALVGYPLVNKLWLIVVNNGSYSY